MALYAPNPGNSTVFHSLSGSLFRRPLRLFLPSTVTTGIVALLARIPNFFKVNKPVPFDTWQEQFFNWWSTSVTMIDPFRAMRIPVREVFWENEFNGAVWTIPVEFKGSVQVLALLLALARTRRWIRLIGIVGAGWWQIVQRDFDMGLFCAGLVLAEAHVSMSGVNKEHTGVRIAEGLRHAVAMAAFVVALYLMSYPMVQGPVMWGFQTMSQMVPEYYVAGQVAGDNIERVVLAVDWVDFSCLGVDVFRARFICFWLAVMLKRGPRDSSGQTLQLGVTRQGGRCACQSIGRIRLVVCMGAFLQYHCCVLGQ